MHAPSSSAVSHVGWQRGFWSLMATQFQNAFSDNALKQLIIYILLASVAVGVGASKDELLAAKNHKALLVAVVTIVFSAPFILFAMLGGWLADRFSKQRVMVNVKVAEIFIMAFATLALWAPGLTLKLCAIFLMGCHSAIFAPSKYGILPEILPHEKLSWGNGILELLTFISVILGTVAAGLFRKEFKDNVWLAGLVLMALAMIGLALSRSITPAPAAAPASPVRINPVTDLFRQLLIMKQDRDLWRACWGNTGFFFISALIMMNVTVFGEDTLKLTDDAIGYLTVWLALGLGLGSVVAGYASRGRIEYRLVPLGALGLALSTIPMGMEGVTAFNFSICMATLGFSAGLFIVPVVSVIQHRPSPESKGSVQGAVSSLSFIGMMVSAGVFWLASEVFNFTSGQVFWVCGASALICGAYAAISRGRFIKVE
jgi:acyl-[acyl-carrier-protein]-phospholipid O-acyltransferase/long-chain-fatty-acid--[acyl-carrier-protein] ligase